MTPTCLMNDLFQYAIIFAIVSLLVMMCALVYSITIVVLKPAAKSQANNMASDDLSELIAREVEQQIKTIEFDSAMVLMEKQRLKKLELQELSLRLNANEAVRTEL